MEKQCNATMFMAYLIDRDRHNIKYLDIDNSDEVNKVIDIYLSKKLLILLVSISLGSR